MSSELRSLDHFFRSKYPDLTASALFSSVDAVENLKTGTGTDVLQTLYKLPQYESMIPHIREAVDILSDIYRKDIHLSTMREIMSLLSATMLQGSFQWRPLLQLAFVELPKIMAALQTLAAKQRLQPVVAYGTWKYNFQVQDISRPNSHLLVGTKIVLDLSARSLFSILAGFDGIGILPKPSNLWDLIPFSFVANWFTGIGASIKRAESSIALLTVPAYYVHTYSITSPFTAEECSIWNIGSSPVEPLSFKLFYRDVSRFSPVPRDSRFGFGIPSRYPPTGIVAALLYQLILG
jgi:hypothetical protein